VGVVLAPLLGEVASEGGAEDGLAELLEQRRDAAQGLLGGVGALLEDFYLGDKALLLVLRSNPNGPC
jgi:hypothetical protein